MKYYSEKVKKLFDDAESLEEAEKDFDAKEAEKAKLTEKRKERSVEIEEAYKRTLEARKEAKEIIRKADEEYQQLVDKFIEDFGSYHMTYTNKNNHQVISVSDMIDNFFGSFNPFIW